VSRRLPILIVGAACLAVLVVCARFGSYVAGGSDSYCYVHQAERWASGRLLVPEPLALEAPWPDAATTFAPAGHRPSSTVPGAIVPICPPGLSMAMAAALLAGGRWAMFAVVPISGLLLVLATAVLGTRVHPQVGLASAVVMAASPIFLYQVIQPMSDVPAAAAWALALAAVTSARRTGPLAAGLAAGAAILIRPNLVPVGLVLGLYLLSRGQGLRRIGDAVVYAAGCAAGCAAVAAIQFHLNGSPFASGYGDLGTLFAATHVGPNLQRYASWLVRSQGPLIAIAVAAPWLWRDPRAWLYLSVFVVVVTLYLPYLVFDDWAFLRFLLPALPVLIVLMLTVVAHAGRRLGGQWGRRWERGVLPVVVLVLVATSIPVAAHQHVFELRQLESSFRRVGEAMATRLPENALVVTSQHSGSVRFYARRRTLVWDVLDGASLDAVVAFAARKGLAPYLLIASGEEAEFRARFSTSPLARLDWPAQVEVAPEVRLYVPGARDQYLRGETVPTEFVR
jgi:hypothetical protein